MDGVSRHGVSKQHCAWLCPHTPVLAGAQAGSEAALLRERARCAEMELMARACAAELLRSQHASMSMGKSMLPALSGIEYRLTSLLRSPTLEIEGGAPLR